MTHSNLRVEVRGSYILVAMRGTSLRAKFRKQEAPWLAMDEYEEDTGALITLQEFRALAWEAANAKARDLGWVRSCDELNLDGLLYRLCADELLEGVGGILEGVSTRRLILAKP